jgi:non-specific protein-tyrosine kinase
VYFVGLERGRTFEVTSARPREGRTQTTVNLAVAIARAGQRVIVVDCDLRRPRVHEFFGLPNDVGFTSVLLGEPLSDALQPIPGVDQLYVLTSGPIPPNPAELLASRRCSEVFDSLQADGTLLLVDTPPLLPVTDAAEVARIVDSVLLVTTARVSTRKRVRQAVQLLRQVGAPLVGTILNRADDAETVTERMDRRLPRGAPTAAPGTRSADGSRVGIPRDIQSVRDRRR